MIKGRLIRIFLGAMLVVVAAVVFGGYISYAPRRVPEGQPALVRLDGRTIGSLRDDFNAAVGGTRLLALLSPTSGVLARVLDRRAAQFWDPERLVSAGLLRIMTADPRAEPRDPVEAGDVVWDCVAIYPPGILWEEGPPEPSYIDCPVVRVIDEVVRRLSSSGSPGR